MLFYGNHPGLCFSLLRRQGHKFHEYSTEQVQASKDPDNARGTVAADEQTNHCGSDKGTESSPKIKY